MAWKECEQLCSAISKNNETKRKINRRLRNNSRQAERFKADLDGKVRPATRRSQSSFPLFCRRFCLTGIRVWVAS